MDRVRGVTGQPFAVFAHVDQDGIRVGLERGKRLGDRYFMHVWATALDVGEKSGGMIHD